MLNTMATSKMKRTLAFLALILTLVAGFGASHLPTTEDQYRRRTRFFKNHPHRGGGYSAPLYQEALVRGGDKSPLLSSASVSTNKTSEEAAFIKESLLENAMFTGLHDQSLCNLIDAFECIPAVSGVIVKQGESSKDDYVYLIANGECTVEVDGTVVPEPYGTLKPASIFGELGVLYNTTRSATISTKSDAVKLYRVRGRVFKDILHESSIAVVDSTGKDTDERIDIAIQQVSGTKSLYGGDIISQYKPERSWLWSRFAGTVFQHNGRNVVVNMFYSLLVIVFIRLMKPAWHIGFLPNHNHPAIQRLDLIRTIWTYQQALTTFVLTFFVNQAYSYWKDIHSMARKVQGKLSDFHLQLATSASRLEDGSYTPAAASLLDDVGTSSRLFHALYWASIARRFSVLSTPYGLQRMAARGLMTSRQLQVLQSLDLPNNQKHMACLEWMMIRASRGIQDGTLQGDQALLQNLLDQTCQIRAAYATICGTLSCRMPLPYAHFVQILVDTFVLLAPLALYAELGGYSVLCVGMLTLFYTGLLDLAKIFLDPLDNEDFKSNVIDLDLSVLIRESNAASTSWKNAGAHLPF